MTEIFADLARLQRRLDHQLQRQVVLGGNLANVDTPGYQAKDLRFREALETARPATTDVAHLSAPPAGAAAGELIDDRSRPAGPDGNNVDLDDQMGRLAANALRYSAVTELISRRLALLRYAASDGER